MDRNQTIFATIAILLLFTFVTLASFYGYQSDLEREKTRREYIKLGYHECNDPSLLKPDKYWSKEPCK
jgi:hypothetical protein